MIAQPNWDKCGCLRLAQWTGKLYLSILIKFWINKIWLHSQVVSFFKREVSRHFHNTLQQIIGVKLLLVIVGVKSQDHTMGLGPHIKFDHVRGEGVGTKRAPDPILMGPKLFKRRSEDKCLLGRTKCGLNMHSASYKDSLQWVLVTGMSPISP